MTDLLTLVAGASAGLFVVALWVLFFMATLGWPLMFFSIMRNVKGIRVQLERLNDATDGRGGAARSGTLGL